jgi:hypothetical protein
MLAINQPITIESNKIDQVNNLIESIIEKLIKKRIYDHIIFQLSQDRVNTPRLKTYSKNLSIIFIDENKDVIKETVKKSFYNFMNDFSHEIIALFLNNRPNNSFDNLSETNMENYMKYRIGFYISDNFKIEKVSWFLDEKMNK